jgi:hypothetical protein
MPILLAMIVVPLLDSMACDDFGRSAPSPGSGLEISHRDGSECLHPCTLWDAGGGGPSSPAKSVHFLCPICHNFAETAVGVDFRVSFLATIFKPQRLQISLAQLNFPIDKPPQN